MPFTKSSRGPLGPRRRSLLAAVAGLGAVLLTGCTDSGGDDPDTTPEQVSAGERARADAARDSRDLLARYDAVLAAHPGLGDRLRPLRAQVAQHAKTLGGSSSASPEPVGAASAGASATPLRVPADEKGARTSLATAERELADRRTRALPAVSGELARLLASVAAAGAAHAYLLTEGDK